ncbi:MAG: hypothetical protein RLZZ383_2033 [Pseudomonadota bacterium]|jgi:L-threonylcarbamoyladenylate synthase
MTRRLRPDQAVAAAAALRDGAIVALPTETVYGLAADVRRPDAIDDVFRAKGRPASDPLIVHVSHALLGDDIPAGLIASGWAADGPWRGAVEALATAAWPGPLTVVLPRGPRASDRITACGPSVAIRIPAHPSTLEVLAHLGDAVVAPSANRFGRISPTHVEAVLAELEGEIDAVLDGGPCDIGIESTVIGLTGEPTILRPGAFDEAQLAQWLGTPVRPAPHRPRTGALAAPGLLDRHYAPQTRLVRLAPTATWDDDAEPPDSAATLLCWSEPHRQARRWTETLPWSCLCPTGDVAGAARLLYATLRALDNQGHQTLYVEVPPQGPGLLSALDDRIRRASSSTPVLRPTRTGLVPA